ncbi:MAG: hypothetical protein HY938_08855 [Nitrosomonadales bacterium]|nr:hypothetical protein [Nitrosomonadales bacterium]
MDYLVRHIKWIIVALLVSLPVFFFAYTRHGAIKERDFVGTWKSSRTGTPVHMHANGEWEIRTEEGSVLQYGVWQYANDWMIWSYKTGGTVEHDANAVLSVHPEEFQVRERDGTTTTFRLIGR